MDLAEALHYRRSVRVFDAEKEIDAEQVKYFLELATLAPNSSNMQLWEFYHLTDPGIMARISHACLDQSSTKTAKQIVVFVTRQDLYRNRARKVLEIEMENIQRSSPTDRQQSRFKNRKLYYGRLMPFIYSKGFGLWGAFRSLLANGMGAFRPMVREVSECDMRVVVHKTCALAAQTFMIAMAYAGYDTCPLEGFDSSRVKKILDLPAGAEINMIIPCGIRKGNEGIWGERKRVPFEEVYRRI